MFNQLELRLNKIEKYISYMKSQDISTYTNAYEIAVRDNDEENAQFFARLIRNKLLYDSDKYMLIDNPNINRNNENSIISDINSLINSDIAVYRKKLRDIPQQEGFPFNIEFPKNPMENKNEEKNMK